MGGVYRHRPRVQHVPRPRYVPSLTAAVAATSLALRSRAVTHYAVVVGHRPRPLRPVSLYERSAPRRVVAMADVTANPPAVEVAPVVASGSGRGVIAMSAALYRATLAGALADDLTAYVAGGVVTHNADAAQQLTFRAAILAPGGLEEWDILAPYLTLSYADGTIDTEPLGLYVVPPATQRHARSGTSGEIDARDLTWILQNNAFGDGYSVAAGTEYAAAMRTVATGAGFAPGRLAIPDSGKTLPAAASWPPGTSRMQVLTDLATGCGYWKPWMDRHGLIVSRPMLELGQVAPARTYDSATDGAELVGEIDDEPDLTRLANQVTVRRLDPSQAALYATLTNDNAASPSSTVALGEKFGVAAFVLARTIDEPTLADQAAADALAASYLSQGASYYRKLTLRTVPDPTAGIHEVVSLAITNEDGEVASGLFWRTGWSLGFTPADNSRGMTHSLARVEPFK